MALPLLNESPRYEVVIPSTGKKIKFRPYLVKEEKVLMLAAETKDSKQMMNAIIDTVSACVTDKIDVHSLTTFDLEYLFIKLRAKSVGEKSTIQINCESCKSVNEYQIDLDSITCKMNKIDNIIKLDDNISVEMKYPSYSQIDITENETEMGFEVLASCLATVYTQDQRIDVSEEPKESVRRFLESMTRAQFEKVRDYFVDMPQVKAEVEFTCRNCDELNKFDIRGIQSFF